MNVGARHSNEPEALRAVEFAGRGSPIAVTKSKLQGRLMGREGE